jgi:hypothetical protein
VFAAFGLASIPASGVTCHTGLLNASAQNQLVCADHPTQSGHQLMALVIETAYRAAGGN